MLRLTLDLGQRFFVRHRRRTKSVLYGYTLELDRELEREPEAEPGLGQKTRQRFLTRPAFGGKLSPSPHDR